MADYVLPRAGQVIGQKYLIVRVLGEGGMGVVYEAIHLKLQQRVALKVLHPEVMSNPDAVHRFEREARATGRIRGPHVAHVLDVDTMEDGAPFMVTELLQGRDLEAELRSRKSLPISEAIDYLLQACAAVSASHASGVIHRDLKPSNLFLTEENGRRVVKVLDFGISKIQNDGSGATSAFCTMGTPMYMSPEQVRSSKDVDERTDVWSLGVILFETIAGTPPFQGTTTAAIAAIVADQTPSIRSVRPEVPEELEQVLLRALAKNREDRYATVRELAEAIMPFATEEGLCGPYSYRRPPATDPGLVAHVVPTRVVREPRRLSFLLGTAKAIVIVAAGITVGVMRTVVATPAAASAVEVAPAEAELKVAPAPVDIDVVKVGPASTPKPSAAPSVKATVQKPAPPPRSAPREKPRASEHPLYL